MHNRNPVSFSAANRFFAWRDRLYEIAEQQKTGCCQKRNRVSVRHTTVNCDTKQETLWLGLGF
jgi:hypothetical protein